MAHPVPDPIAPGQESVWDYPRPPRIERVESRVVIRLGGEGAERGVVSGRGGGVVADPEDGVRVREPSHPPVYYLPIASFPEGALADAEGSSYCEFKGSARYLDVRGGGMTASKAAWNYPR